MRLNIDHLIMRDINYSPPLSMNMYSNTTEGVSEGENEL